MSRHPLLARLESDDGYTIIELLTIIAIMAIIIVMAAPAYSGIQTRAEQESARSTIRAANQSIEAYYQDYGTFDGMTAQVLHDDYDTEIHPWVSGTTFKDAVWVESTVSGSSYWLCTKSGSWWGYKSGPAADIKYSSTSPTDEEDATKTCPIP